MPLSKLVIIGLDAADFRLTQQFMDDGDLPRLSVIRDKNGFSSLKSVIPPHTAPGWTSITTGVNPGKHGIFYFYNFSTSPPTVTNTTNSSTPRIWDYVESFHENSVVVNVPITYPVSKISGFIVSGIPPWYIDERSVYPQDLLKTLKSIGYEIDTPMNKNLEKNPDALVNRLVATEKKRVDLFLDLLKEKEWSFGMIVLTALDRLQHKMLGKDGNVAVRKCYSEIDALVGKIVDSLGSDVNVLIVSDHGFNFRPVALYPNAWLHEQGLLKRKSSIRFRLSRIGHGIVDGHFNWLPQRIMKRFQGGIEVIYKIDAVDLAKSRAFVPGTDGIIVVKSKEDQKLIISGLSKLKDDSGKEVCTVYTRDQVFKGDRLNSAPELLIVPRDDVNIRTNPFSRTFVSTSGNFTKANHSPNGVFFATGPNIVKSESLDIRLEDIAPTALALMGVLPSESMDGKIIKDIILEPLNSLKNSQLIVDDKSFAAFSEKDEKLVLENLKRLGYT